MTANGDSLGERDPDDWFAEPEPSPPRRIPSHPPTGREQDAPPLGGGRPSIDDWFGGESAGGRRQTARLRVWRSSTRVTVAAGLVALVAGLITLAAAGVFSGRSRSHAATRPNRPAPAATTPAAAPTTSPRQLPTTTLKPGEHGAQVRRLQQALARLGYSPGKIDGQYGSATTHALANFQRANNLTADGVLGPATRAALKHALRSAG